MQCPKCGSDIEMMVDVTIICPSSLEGVFSKQNLRQKAVKIYAVNWSKASYFCTNDSCGWMLRPKRQPMETTCAKP